MADKQLVLQETHKNLMALLTSKQEAMPKDFNQTRFLQNCMTVLQDTKDIEKCQPISVARTLLKGAFLGLDFFQKECYAIPYGSSLQFQTDYKGETKMAKKYSIRPIKDIYAKVVREGDFFEDEIKEGQQIVNFKPLPFSNNPIIGAFAIVLYQDGGMEYETMSTEQIEGIRNNFSKMKNGLMWSKTPEEAYKKTVLRRLTKKIEKDFESAEQATAYEESADADFKKNEENAKRNAVPDILYKQEEVIDAECREVTEKESSPFDVKDGEK
ncbi:recombination protein RecT [Sporomusaceae bacterium BoRhaA]|uniref:RecT family recombinase n=1 Tax=Pelorhabdus rhamnosifermentans TaxID=2772457 RepID=UPI001C063AFD|nr:RecT family recombinase [Pelorhabdus rhamnosifermentans]MBU2701106.1 recombination protein RecT [Pelorhabdus rhamnosifermentans]